MDVILKDGTMITNAKVSDIEEMMAKGIIGKCNTTTTAVSPTQAEPWQANIPYGDTDFFGQLTDNSTSFTEDTFNECHKLCQNNELIPKQDYTNFDGTNYDAPGMDSIMNMVHNKHIIDIIDGTSASNEIKPVNFPTVEFTSTTTGNITNNSIETSATAKSANHYSLDRLTGSLMSRADRNSFDPEENTKEDYKKYIDGLKQRKNW